MRIPKLCHHKGQERGLVYINRREHYFEGKWPRNQKKAPHAILTQYEAWRLRFLEEAQRQGNGRPAPQKPIKSASIGEVWELYWTHATGYYLKGGKPTSELYCLKSAGRVLARLYGETDAARFTLWDLEAVQQEFVRLGWARETVNEQVGRVRRVFKWAAFRRLIPEAVAHDLLLLPTLKKGRTPARETPPVQPVPWELVERTLPLLNPVLRAMVQVHYLLGCRSEDVTPMRPVELDRTGPVWLYRPASWKTEHHEGHAPLAYWVGPRAQQILTPLLADCPDEGAWVFSTRTVRGHGAHRRGCYTTGSYRTAIKRVLAKHGLPEWTPLRLRHLRLTEIGNSYGVEMAQTVAMHSELDTTRIYAEKNLARTREIMAAIG